MHAKSLVITTVGLLFVSACAPHGSERWWIEQIDKEHARHSLIVDGVSYRAVYKAVGATVGYSREESPDYGYDAFVTAQGSNEIPVIYDSGLPMVVVSREDGASLTAADYDLAVYVAEEACLNKPDWKRDLVLGYQDPAPFPVSARGAAFLKNGAWSVYEICE